MPDINVSPNPNSAPNLQDFTTAAGRAGGGGQAVSVEGGKVGEMGRFARVFSRAESNRAAMRSFRDALREEFGGGAANTAVRELLNRDYAAGKPLTARHIVQATARARQEAETTALPEFIAGRGFASGREITLGDGRHPYTLDGALDAFLESRDIQVNEADRRFLKERIVSALSRPGANQGAASRKELFQRVRGGKIGDLDPLTRAQPSGAMQDKARLIDLLGKGQEYAVASRFIGEMRALQPEGALTGATVLRACFHEEAPAEEAGDLRQQVQERVARYSSPEAVGRELADAGIPADILERIPEKTMQGLASRVEARIAAAADDAPLTPERAAQVRKEALGKFAASCLAAGELAQTHPTDAESLMRLVLTNAAPPSPALLAALPGMADRVPPDTLHALASGDTDRAADALDSLRRCMTSDILPSMRDVDNLPEMGGEDIAKGGGQIMALLAGRMTREDAGALASGFAAGGPAAKTMEAMSRYLLLRSERDLAFNPMTVIDTLRGASLALADRGGIPRSEISSPSVFGKVEPHDLPPSLRVRLEIDLLPEPRDPASPREGEFTPAQKALMKEAIYRRNVQDANVLTTLLRAADSRLEIVRRLASPGIAPDQLAAGVRDLFARYQEEQGRPGAPALPADGMEIMLDLAVGLAGFDDAQIGTLAAHLQRDESVVSASRRYASPEAVRQELADAGIPADILERMPETTLRDLTARVGTRIANAASSSDAPLTPERAAGIRREALGDFIASCEAARELAQTHPADAESLMRLALANARPPSPALLAALPGL
ncbi:MAG: hypothetical protein LBQ63_06360, partial [Deltaproteobacteria bacterium]|nr:hypothetical protein [Deltaproteobacteria bacterium]